jgi:hypothetical protein
LSASQHHNRVFLLLPEVQQQLRMLILFSGLSDIFSALYACPHPPSEDDEVGSSSLLFIVKLMI